MLDRKLRPITKFVHEKEKKYSVYKEQKKITTTTKSMKFSCTHTNTSTHTFFLFFSENSTLCPPNPPWPPHDPSTLRPRADAASKLFSVLFFSLLDSVFLHNRNVKFDTYKRVKIKKNLLKWNFWTIYCLMY